MTRRHALSLAVMLIACAGTPQAALARDASDGFERGLERLHEHRVKERFEKGLAGLQSLLKQHKNERYVRAYRAELEDLAERLAFGEQFPAPSPEDVLTGDVRKYDPSSGMLELRIHKEHAEELKSKGEYMLFPPKIRGPFLLEIRGDAYPSDANKAPRVVFGGRKHPKKDAVEFWHVSFGSPRRELGDRVVWLTSKIFYQLGEEQKLISKEAACPAKVGKRYTLHAKFSKGSISAGVNGKPVVGGRRKGDVEGWVQFSSPNWTSMKFTGTIEPAWIQTRLDKRIQRDLATFRKSFDVKRFVPEWLYGTVGTPNRVPLATLPAPIEAQQRGTYIKYEQHLDELDFQAALDAVEALTKEGTTPATIEYLRAVALRAFDRPTDALKAIDYCLQATPKFTRGSLLRARILARLGREDESLAAFRKTIDAHPNEPRGYEDAAIACLRMGRPKDARAFTVLAAGNSVETETLEAIGTTLVRALHGPTWNRRYEYASENYRIVSDIDKKSCQEAAKLLEEALTSYRVQLHWTKKVKGQRFSVYLFNGQAGFKNYMKDLNLGVAPPNWVAGVYNSTLKQLLIWNLPSKQAMRETIRHEGFHQYMDSLIPDPPVWFNEGLAVYHENAERKRGSLVFGNPHPNHVALLKQKGLIPLNRFIYRGAAGFYGDAERSYAQAWALVHMLKKGNQAHRALFKKLMKELQEAESSVVLARHFTPERLTNLEADLKQHIAELTAK